ncbi:DNA ligase 1-like [Leptopilina heterotoma]|uniref:DNA ligase 1-like n=1 Tax=Leptopilina heterotoma TaxID=63436 RepID=UPI001CA95BA2|nr:DNA ligase 1-like [Leptopilina heterotoma]
MATAINATVAAWSRISLQSQTCNEDEYFAELADEFCEMTCDNMHEGEKECVKRNGRCLCNEPNVRDNKTQLCVHPDDCFKPKAKPIENNCKKFEAPSASIENCEKNCDGTQLCPKVAGDCICIFPYERDTFTSECILQAECLNRKNQRAMEKEKEELEKQKQKEKEELEKQKQKEQEELEKQKQKEKELEMEKQKQKEKEELEKQKQKEQEELEKQKQKEQEELEKQKKGIRNGKTKAKRKGGIGKTKAKRKGGIGKTKAKRTGGIGEAKAKRKGST